MGQIEFVYRDKYFGISSEGLHLMRNGYNYKTIAKEDIKSIRIGVGRSIRNWIILLILGLLMISGSIGYLFYGFTIAEEIYREAIAGCGILVFLGIYCLYLSIRTEEVIEFSINGKKEAFATKEIKESNKYETLRNFLELNYQLTA